ncbi:hypothetical protein [Swaminathania salitolerans]|nr:hypothetical protein [Swaminathania salitolerans]GBQ12022.1 hypothetical protein AA21291_1044 [Swaminathania salitolerans LMG 21291]
MKSSPRQKPDVPTINVRELIIMHIVLALVIAGIVAIDWHLN